MAALLGILFAGDAAIHVLKTYPTLGLSKDGFAVVAGLVWLVFIVWLVRHIAGQPTGEWYDDHPSVSLRKQRTERHVNRTPEEARLLGLD